MAANTFVPAGPEHADAAEASPAPLSATVQPLVVAIPTVHVPVSADLDPLGTSPAPENAASVKAIVPEPAKDALSVDQWRLCWKWLRRLQ